MSISRALEVASSTATIIVAALLCAVLAKVYLLPSSGHPAGVPDARPGMSLRGRLQGVDWARNGRTLVMVLSTQCHFCTESAPFLHRLSQRTGKAAKLLAVLPQPTAEGQQYLDEEGVRVDGVLQASPASLGVRGTPTLLLVNGAGVVTDVWVGKLKPDQESQLLATVADVPRASAASERTEPVSQRFASAQ
jgi:hypothetical protein